MMWNETSMGRTCSASTIQRGVIQHHGHRGSNPEVDAIAHTLRSTPPPVHPTAQPGPAPRTLLRVTAPNLTPDQAAARRDVLHDVALPDRPRPHRRPASPARLRFPRRRRSPSAPRRARRPLSTSRRPAADLGDVERHRTQCRRYDEEVGLTLPDLAARNELVVVADCAYSNTGEGLHPLRRPADGAVYLYSQFRPPTPAHVRLLRPADVKAVFDIAVTAPADWNVISNGATGRRPADSAPYRP